MPANASSMEMRAVRDEAQRHVKWHDAGGRTPVKPRLRRIPLPSIILANVQSLRNKTDELQANSNYLHEYRNACIMAFSETWLSSRDSDADLSISGFGAPVRLDRDAESTGKSQGGGVCSNITVRESICTADIELLSLFARSISQENSPRYL